MLFSNLPWFNSSQNPQSNNSNNSTEAFTKSKIGFFPVAWQGWAILLGYFWFLAYNVMSAIYSVNYFVSQGALLFQLFAVFVNLSIGTTAFILVVILANKQ